MRIGNYRYDQEVAVDLLEKVGFALAVLIVTWAAAKGAKWAFAKLVDNVAFFRRATGSGQSLGESLGKIVSLLIWLFGLLIILTVLGLGYLISKFVVQLLGEILPGLGVDRAVAATDLLPDGATASNVIARVTQIAIILFFAIAATRLLGFPELTAILDQVLELGGRVIFGAVVILFGFLIANMLARLITGSGETSLAASVVRWVTVVLFTFMGLEFMGVGEDVVRMAFGALVIGGGVAGALAFGLGGRDWAKRKLDQIDRPPTG